MLEHVRNPSSVINREKLQNEEFYSDYWGELPNVLKQKGYTIKWLHVFGEDKKDLEEELIVTEESDEGLSSIESGKEEIPESIPESNNIPESEIYQDVESAEVKYREDGSPYCQCTYRQQIKSLNIDKNTLLNVQTIRNNVNQEEPA